MAEVRYSVVVPVYRSSDSLVELARRAAEVFGALQDGSYELIFVNDSPFDTATVQTLELLARDDQAVKVVELTRNFGQQPATLCGLDMARGQYIITMDDDLQHDPYDIPKLIDKAEHDVVIARLTEIKHNIFKKVTSSIKGYFDYLLIGKPKHIKLSSFRLIHAEIAKMTLLRTTPFPFMPALLFSVTDDIVNVDIGHRNRSEGRSNYTLGKMLGLFSNLLINNSSLLLRMTGYLGAAASLLSAFAAVYIFLRKITGEMIVPGYASVVILLLFFGGMTLFALGVIGEYLIRLIATAEHRPSWLVRRTID